MFGSPDETLYYGQLPPSGQEQSSSDILLSFLDLQMCAVIIKNQWQRGKSRLATRCPNVPRHRHRPAACFGGIVLHIWEIIRCNIIIESLHVFICWFETAACGAFYSFRRRSSLHRGIHDILLIANCAVISTNYEKRKREEKKGWNPHTSS